MSNKQTIYQVVTGVSYEGLGVNKHWKAFKTAEAAKEYAWVLNDTESMEYDYVGIVETELE
jgi:hypothetical protein